MTMSTGFVPLAFAAFVILRLAGPAFAQTTTASEPTGNAMSQAGAGVIKTSARLVVVDVTVTDSHGRPVPGLTLQDFLVKENGVPQVPKSLDDHTGAALVAAAPPLVKGTYSNRPAIQSSVWNVLVLDLLNTARIDQARTRQEVLRFAKTLPPGIPVALVLVTSSSTKVLVRFTLSGAAIEKALETDLANPQSSPLLQTFNADDEDIKDQLVNGGIHGPSAGGLALIRGGNLNNQQSEMTLMDMRIEQSLRSLAGIAGWLSRYPGKKNLYWLSSGFPLTAEPAQGRDANAAGDSAAAASRKGSYLLLQRETDKQLENARVAVFPLDVRGNPGAGREGVDTPDIKGARIAGRGGPGYNDDVSQYDRRVNESQAGMMEIAETTGGVATINRNNIAEILSDQFQQASQFYTLSYSPKNADWNGDYRKISLALAKRGYKLYYRHGYYAFDAATGAAQQSGPQNTVDAFSLAMRSGARPARGVLFTTRMDRAADGQLNLASSIDLHTLSLSAISDGRQIASVDCAVVEYDDTGKVLGMSQIHSETKLKPGQAEQLHGLPAQQKVPLAAGAKWISVGIRDHESGKFGTLQIPVDGQ